MNNIKQYIFEKLKLNKNIQVNNTSINVDDTVYVVALYDEIDARGDITFRKLRILINNGKVIKSEQYQDIYNIKVNSNTYTYYDFAAFENSNHIFEAFQHKHNFNSDSYYLIFIDKNQFINFIQDILIPIHQDSNVGKKELYKYWDKNDSFIEAYPIKVYETLKYLKTVMANLISKK